MRIEFRATIGAFDVDEHALVCGVAGQDQYLTFQRDTMESDDDSGIYLEYGDQANGAYGKITKCRLSRELLQVDLSSELGCLAEVDGFDVTLSIDDAAYRALDKGLRQVFRGHLDLLEATKGGNLRI